MHRRKAIMTAAAVFAIGVAFAAEPTSERGVSSNEDVLQRGLWVPGTNMLMSKQEWNVAPLAPPR